MTITEETTSQHFRNRVRKIKDLLPANYRKIIYSNFPEYKVADKRKLIANVVSGSQSNIALTQILESIASGELKIKA